MNITIGSTFEIHQDSAMDKHIQIPQLSSMTPRR